MLTRGRPADGWYDDPAGGMPADRRPICVDLDAALLRADPAALDRQWLWWLLWLVSALTRGRVRLGGGRAVGHPMTDRGAPPFSDELLVFLQAAHAQGRELALFSSADAALVEGVARRLPIFRVVRGGLAGRRKFEAAREAYGDGGFVFVGRRGGPPLGPTRLLGVWARALRLHQWAKNLLVFVPVTLAGPLVLADQLLEAALAFLVFGLLASAGYLVNDLLDLEADRHHSGKRRRPLAAGDLPAWAGIVAVPCLVLPAVAICTLMPLAFVAVALAYFVATVAYSLYLKKQPLLDVIVLAGLFTLRVLGGAMLLAKPISYWLLSFTMFLFLSLALIKRCSELKAAPGPLRRRGYTQDDLHMLIPLGLSSAVAANVIFVTYLLNDPYVTAVYRQPQWLWLIFPILLWWVLRLWRLTIHDRMHEDPVLFALHDRLSLGMGVGVLALLVLAWW